MFISRVSDSGPCCEAGIRVGDKLLQVNNTTLRDADHHRAVEVLKTAGSDVTMHVARKYTKVAQKVNGGHQQDGVSDLFSTVMVFRISCFLG